MKRSEQKLNDTWDLSSLCIDKNDFNTRYEGLLKDLPTLGSFNKTLSLSSDNLYTALEFIKNFLKEEDLHDRMIYKFSNVDKANHFFALKQMLVIVKTQSLQVRHLYYKQRSLKHFPI